MPATNGYFSADSFRRLVSITSVPTPWPPTMKLMRLTLPSAAENLALDEALVESADQSPANAPHDEVLRLWEPQETFVVIGRSSSLEQEVNLPWCRKNRIGAYRRASGGASIVTGPGCLMYAVLLDMRRRENLRMLDQAHQFVMQNMASALGSIGVQTDIAGTCDLTIGNRKVSGNSLRVKRNFLIYHGTMICSFDTSTISQCLHTPKRQPDYRQRRSHDQFVASIDATTSAVGDAIAAQWQATTALDQWPREMTSRLAAEKYASDEWLKRVP